MTVVGRSSPEFTGPSVIPAEGSPAAKIQGFETFLANAGLRNYLFIRLRTDTGLTGIGEATLEWQEQTVQTLVHEWVEGRVLGRDPFDIEAVVGGMIRDQYQGGSTVMTAISGVEIALWDLIGKACGQPVYRLLGGRCHDADPGLCQRLVRRGAARRPNTPSGPATPSPAAIAALKFDPFGTAWKELIARAGRGRRRRSSPRSARRSGRAVGLMIEFHGRLSAGCGHRDDPPARAVRSRLVRGAGRAREPRPAGRGQAVGPAARSPPASGSIRWPTSTG